MARQGGWGGGVLLGILGRGVPPGKNNQKTILIVGISRAWCSGSYTVAAKPIKSLEYHNTIIK